MKNDAYTLVIPWGGAVLALLAGLSIAFTLTLPVNYLLTTGKASHVPMIVTRKKGEQFFERRNRLLYFRELSRGRYGYERIKWSF